MLFTNVMKTLLLITLYIAVPGMLISLSRQAIKRLIRHLRTGPHRT